MEMRWKVGSGLPGVDEEAASLQPELCPVWEKYYLFYLIITIKLVGIFVTIKKNICSSFFDGTRVCF
jgi:hypothetical protein